MHLGRFSSIPFLIFLLTLLLTLSLSVLTAACGSDPASLVGTWVSEEQGETLELRYDGTAVLLTKEGRRVGDLRWGADARNLLLGPVGEDTVSIRYTVRDGVLKLTYPGEDAVEYVRSDVGID